ncbi:hypothetical protein LCGC14_2047320 [marine sediment metagenome]|uniref:Uncharacterized protein n=1 Tax=marine sediment metagenome TaxID=412755 RepID=A0A0F9FCJ9_9ZZZZ
MVEFPVIHDKYPLCGCEETLAQSIMDDLIKERRAGPGGKAGTIWQSPIYDPLRTTLAVPILQSILGICANPVCGVVFCLRADKQVGPTHEPSSS